MNQFLVITDLLFYVFQTTGHFILSFTSVVSPRLEKSGPVHVHLMHMFVGAHAFIAFRLFVFSSLWYNVFVYAFDCGTF